MIENVIHNTCLVFCMLTAKVFGCAFAFAQVVLIRKQSREWSLVLQRSKIVLSFGFEK